LGLKKRLNALIRSFRLLGTAMLTWRILTDENQDAADIKRITEAMDKAFGNNPMLQSIGEIIKRHKAGQQHYLAVRTKSPEWEFFFP
jgi:hypothetical protein